MFSRKSWAEGTCEVAFPGFAWNFGFLGFFRNYEVFSKILPLLSPNLRNPSVISQKAKTAKIFQHFLGQRDLGGCLPGFAGNFGFFGFFRNYEVFSKNLQSLPRNL